MVIAHHIILTGYGHWLPNDPRGSMSREVHSARIAELGPDHDGAHTGRLWPSSEGRGPSRR